MSPGGRVWFQSWQSAGKSGILWNERAQDYTTSDLTNVERLTNISAKVKSTGRSVALGLCSKMARVKNESRVLPTDDSTHCGPHALIANGVQWNSAKKRCEIHIRNSWGAETSLQGWLPIEPVLNSKFRISVIEPK